MSEETTPTSTATSTLMDVEAVQKAIGRSRASVYRYANTENGSLNPPYNPTLLNPEYRTNKEDPLMFHPNEVARFAKDVLGQSVTIEVKEPPDSKTQELLRAILTELKEIRQILDK